MRILTNGAPPCPGAGLAGKESKHMSRNAIQALAIGQFFLNVRKHALNNRAPIR
jgi:hypothetical protein